jgi:hypothetical protein
VAPGFANILSKMVRDNFQERYQSASEALNALNQLVNAETLKSLPSYDSSINTLSMEDSDTPTTPWDGNQ